MALLITLGVLGYVYTMSVLLYIAKAKKRSLFLNFLGALIVSPLIQMLILAMLPQNENQI